MTTQTTVSNLKINKLTSAQYATITPSDTELYFLTDETAPATFTALNPSLTPTSDLCSWTITHNLGTNISINVYDASTGAEVLMQVTSITATQATIQLFSTTNIAANTYKAVVIGG